MFRFIFSAQRHDVLADIGSLLLRILIGLSLCINHGWPTIVSLLEGETGYPDPIGLGQVPSKILMGFTEFVCAGLVVLGLFTRVSSIALIFGFSIALFVFHYSDPFPRKELAYLYWTASLVLFFIGPGNYSLDRWINGAKYSG